MQAIISCEHASNRIPETLISLFGSKREILQTHRAHDIGAREMAEFLADTLQAPLHLAPVSRLVVDCNRSLGHPALFSTFTKKLPTVERETILVHYYHPYRQAVLQSAQDAIQKRGFCLHLGVHSFAPVLNGKKRTAEIGLLYDPSRIPERNLCSSLAQALNDKYPLYRTRCNYPYRGVSDGLIPALRKSFTQTQYIGIELELNQSLFDKKNLKWSNKFALEFSDVWKKVYKKWERQLGRFQGKNIK